MPYIIDGHNVISYTDDIELSDPNDEAKLVLKLRGFCARKRKKCLVIFDQGLPGGTSGLTTYSVKVIFASARRTNADQIIMERIQHTTDASNWTVVSSDEEIRIAAQTAGMNAMHSAAFAELLNPPEQPKPHRGIAEQVRISESEIEEWLEVFGEDLDPDMLEPPAQRKREQRPQKKRPRQQPTKSRQQPTQSTPQPPQVNADDSEAADSHVSDKQVDGWMKMFDEGNLPEPTDKADRIKPRRHSSAEAGDDDAKEASKAPDENSVEAWLQVFGEGDTDVEPTDPAPQRNQPDKQGHFSKQHRREPTVHANMGTSEDVFLTDGEVDAWLRMFREGKPDE